MIASHEHGYGAHLLYAGVLVAPRSSARFGGIGNARLITVRTGGFRVIIVLSPNDAGIINLARGQSHAQPGTFGQTFVTNGGQIPQLQPNESLVFIGHGTTRGTENSPQIGDANGDFGLDGVELWDNFRSRFPAGYTANVYIDACQSANFPRNMFSLIEVFKSQADPHLPRTRIFGRAGAAAGAIPAPGDRGWVQA